MCFLCVASSCASLLRFYCANGTRIGCPAGTFQNALRKSSESDCRPCTAGGYCGLASSAPTPCGNNSVYCPTGSSAPLLAGAGYYTDGFPGARSVRVLCTAGQYCPGDGVGYDCPAGCVPRFACAQTSFMVLGASCVHAVCPRSTIIIQFVPCVRSFYGSTDGLSSPSCSGACGDGVLCAPGSTTAVGVPCPAGQYCLAGIGLPCPVGTFNPDTGSSNVTSCQLCPPGTYNAFNGSSATSACISCDGFEGSNSGASVCWPGIRGEQLRLPWVLSGPYPGLLVCFPFVRVL